MTITYQTLEVKKPVMKYRLISKWLKDIILSHELIPGDITYVFCGDECLKEMNSKYLNHDYYTDIVTFDYNSGATVSGDMFISIDRVKENSVIYGCAIQDEFLRVIVHGLLHLLSFNDCTDRERNAMRMAENEALIFFKELLDGCIK